MLAFLSPAAERVEARRMVHDLHGALKDLREKPWLAGRPDQAACADRAILQMIRAWRRQHTATLRWTR